MTNETENVNEDHLSFVSGHPDLDNHTETVFLQHCLAC